MTRAEHVLDVARSQLGVCEAPAGTNRVKYNDWYYGKEVSGSAYPWCMAFVQWCCSEAFAPLPFKTASCSALLRWYREHEPERVVTAPKAGDIVIFDLPGGAAVDHTGIFERVQGESVVTIDGNTGAGNEANGGAVLRRTRNKSCVAAYLRPRGWEEEEEEESMKRYQTIEEIERSAPWAAETVRALVERGALKGGGTGLGLSEDMLRVFVVCERLGL